MKKQDKFLTVSFLTITLNPNIHIFKRSLESIQKQDYPKENIEHIIIDGGSNKEIIDLAQKYGCKIKTFASLQNESEARMAIALKQSRHDIVVWFASDNILPETTSLTHLLKPFNDDPKIISTFTLHYNHNKQMSLLDRYCALIGSSDPVVLYLKKTDRETFLSDSYTKGTHIRKRKLYEVVEFTHKSLPTVGANGFFTRREILIQANISPKNFFHIDVYVDLLQKGYKRYGVVRSTAIEHVIGKNILSLARRRVLYMDRYTLSDNRSRRYTVFNSASLNDIWNLLKYIIYTITIIEPLIFSIRGFIRKRDKAWFIHPLMCWIFLIYYGQIVILIFLKSKRSKII